MSAVLSQLEPAPKDQITLFQPYFPSGNKREILPFALSLYRLGNLEGERYIDGGDGIPFVATWNVSSMPLDLSRCQMQFEGNPDLTYDMVITNYEFVGFLVDLLIHYKRTQRVDFPQEFYRRLLNIATEEKKPTVPPA
ncbi:MAG: hypothetical protein RMI89_01065 [Gloeomargarita sp. SKYBB_i_bin120]|nr:hypothetical protein [Gloeomargarita sp. SKYG98]MCS7291552.1 hypothetical protein [Gloeomargarita sp. SKYB120]MDW8177112.1 hypothetical protein [Gloeomargarita sp. SKYBB_i_bin120]